MEWTKEKIAEIYHPPLLELLYQAATVHREYHNSREVQISKLVSIKTDGCPEDCGYCPQAARYHTNVEGNDLMSVHQVKAQALRAKELLTRKEQLNLAALHVFFTSGEACYVGVSQAKMRSPFENGICRLKFPPKAPSRSTLKLEEALLTMLSARQRGAICRAGARAVDLGACPGGWTYQLVSRDMHVEAVDNGKMADDLMATGLVDYRAEDGFKYRPQMGHVELLVCDMIEKPDRVAVLMANWLTRNWATHAIFNLKLPMKRRYETVRAAIEAVGSQLASANINASMVIRHLYHNRDEVTVAVIRKN